MRDAPLITVVMPLLNTAHPLCGSMQSLIMQQWRDFEVVLVDGGCRDGSTDLAGQLLGAAGIRHRIALLTDSGIDEAMNHGVALAEGRAA